MTLFAIALPEEARYVPSGARVCITVPGKVRSAVALAKALADAPTTGDAFLADPRKPVALAEHADLVDMEGFAIAHTAREFGVTCEMFKIVTDSADDRAWSWSETVDIAAAEIGRLMSQMIRSGRVP